MTAPHPTPNPATTTKPRGSSTKVARKSPLGWLPWAALLLLALLVLAVLLVINAVDDDGPSGPEGDTLGRLSSDAQSGPGAAPAPGGAAAPAPAPGAGSSALTSGGQDVLAAGGSSLAARVGQPVTGTADVESVVSDEGFWVGSSRADRVFVFLSPAARQSAGESGFQVTAGQTVRLTGAVLGVRSAPSSLAGVTDAEGRAQLDTQGAFIQAQSVALAG